MTTIPNPVVAALPGAGWYAVSADKNSFETWTAIVGWLVKADGSCRPFIVNQAGEQSDPTTLPGFVGFVEPKR